MAGAQARGRHLCRVEGLRRLLKVQPTSGAVSASLAAAYGQRRRGVRYGTVDGGKMRAVLTRTRPEVTPIGVPWGRTSDVSARQASWRVHKASEWTSHPKRRVTRLAPWPEDGIQIPLTRTKSLMSLQGESLLSVYHPGF